ncbi:MAG TPA: hypothetical protein DD409_06550 [Bacteroidales bacterium]|nr:hypothetical protein [Bacteroidales bacterium]
MVRQREMGYLMATVALVFLTLLMTALLAKLVAMALAGVSVVPAIFIIPLIALSAGILGVGMLRKIKK